MDRWGGVGQIAWAGPPARSRNPRYTGRQVWNKQRTDEILVDVDDVAMGHTSVMRWNPSAQWVVSNEVVHPPIIDMETFESAQALLHRRGSGPGGEHKRHRARHVYVFKGALYCGLVRPEDPKPPVQRRGVLPLPLRPGVRPDQQDRTSA